ncbi:glycosyltransferase family 4 protein [Chryseobacterium lathyri]|uniref:glycosyltransferase family 4 protein n=1 Tax=Chryseobacterium lathyri TaxID=395933 RepID=UPI002788BB20|nr:glycosyltransferase family 4 protein [Chryseobacterium lathyri]MDQ0067556.1 glycosyltransferase involved in cell wall biosynthesis [Chryseobacterium lathyri]
MKIVHLCLSSFYIDDYSYQENMLPKYHTLQGHDVTVLASMVTFNSKGQQDFLTEESTKICKDNYKVIRIDYKKPFYKFSRFLRIYKDLNKYLYEEKPDLLFIHDYSFLDITVVLKYLKNNKNVKVYVDCHTDYINSAKTWLSKNIFHHIIWRYYGKVLSPYVTKFYGVTPLRCDFLRDAYRISLEKTELLEMGIDDVVFEQKMKENTGERLRSKYNLGNDFVIVTGGKIDYLKNIHLVMEAFNQVNKEIPNIKLIVFGTVNPEINDLFEKLLKESNGGIIFVNWLSAEDILDYFILADLIMFPGTHSVLWEQAVGSGTPSFFKHWDGMTHVDVGGNCRFLYKDSADEIYKELKEVLINDKSEYKKMLENARNKGLEKFSYNNIAKRAIS